MSQGMQSRLVKKQRRDSIKRQCENSHEGEEFYLVSFGQKKKKLCETCIQCKHNVNNSSDSLECKHVVAWAVSVIKFSYEMELLSSSA